MTLPGGTLDEMISRPETPADTAATRLYPIDVHTIEDALVYAAQEADEERTAGEARALIVQHEALALVLHMQIHDHPRLSACKACLAEARQLLLTD